MRTHQWHIALILVIVATVKVSAFTNPSPFQLTSTRGGDTTTEEDEQIDDYIESLIRSVDSSSESSSEDVRDEMNVEDVFGGGSVEEESSETDADTAQSDKDEHLQAAAALEDSLENKALELDEAKEEEEEEEATDNEAEFINGETTLATDENASSEKRKKRRTRQSTTDSQKQQEETTDVDAAIVEEETPPPRALGPARPNALYRFLLNQGRIGHVLVLICVLVVELIQTYLPPVAHALGFVFSFLSTSDDAARGTSFRSRAPHRADGPKVNAQYAAFVSSDGTLVRGKQRKKQVRKADEQAVEKLRRVGSIQEAKFRHASEDFLKRHRIGSYRELEESEKVVIYNGRDSMVKAPVDEEESDVDWVVEALSKEENVAKATSSSSSPIETSFGVGLGSDGATISVGVQFGSSTTASKKKKKRRKTLAEVATERPAEPKKKPAGPRTSDRDGGGGVIGRIRAAGANSLVSRSLLGAYPGDAVPPSEAGSANGVISLAEKYGYGDWSDSDEEEDHDISFGSPQRKVKKRVTRKPKFSKPSSSSSGGVSIQFGLSSSGSTRSRTATKPRRPSSATRKRDSIKDPVQSTEKSEILTGRPTSQLPDRKRVQVRPPLEKLNLAKEKAKRRREDEE